MLSYTDVSSHWVLPFRRLTHERYVLAEKTHSTICGVCVANLNLPDLIAFSSPLGWVDNLTNDTICSEGARGLPFGQEYNKQRAALCQTKACSLQQLVVYSNRLDKRAHILQAIHSGGNLERGQRAQPFYERGTH